MEISPVQPEPHSPPIPGDPLPQGAHISTETKTGFRFTLLKYVRVCYCNGVLWKHLGREGGSVWAMLPFLLEILNVKHSHYEQHCCH